MNDLIVVIFILRIIIMLIMEIKVPVIMINIMSVAILIPLLTKITNEKKIEMQYAQQTKTMTKIVKR